MRTFICKVCRHEFETETTTGPTPSWCNDHHPLRNRRDHQQAMAQRRAVAADQDKVRRLETRVQELEALLQCDAPCKLGPPSKLTVATAIRRLANARGRDDTRRALLDLALAAQDWARDLASGDGRPDRPDFAADRAA